MSHTQEAAVPTDSTPYKDASMSCGHCNYTLKPTYHQAFELVRLQPINCYQCSSDLLLDEADRQVLDKKLHTATRIGKLALLILGPYFLISLLATLYFMFFTKPPFPGFSGVLFGGGLLIGFLLKSAATDSEERDFVLFKQGERPPAQTQAA